MLSHVQLCDPGQNSVVGSLPLPQGIFPTQRSNPGLPHCSWIIYQLSYKGSPRILEWVAYPFSSRSSWPRNWTGVSHCRRILYQMSYQGSPSPINVVLPNQYSLWKVTCFLSNFQRSGSYIFFLSSDVGCLVACSSETEGWQLRWPLPGDSPMWFLSGFLKSLWNGRKTLFLWQHDP